MEGLLSLGATVVFDNDAPFLKGARDRLRYVLVQVVLFRISDGRTDTGTMTAFFDEVCRAWQIHGPPNEC